MLRLRAMAAQDNLLAQQWQETALPGLAQAQRWPARCALGGRPSAMALVHGTDRGHERPQWLRHDAGSTPLRSVLELAIVAEGAWKVKQQSPHKGAQVGQAYMPQWTQKLYASFWPHRAHTDGNTRRAKPMGGITRH